MQELIDFLYAGLVAIFAGIGDLLLYVYFSLMLFLVDIFWKMGQDIIAFYDVMGKIDTLFSNLNPGLVNAFAFFKVKECVHLLATARITRYLFSFIS
ncbi:hypothetical protein [Beggiatoa leptomitoformis]|uniref:DUF2523 domain-containing protein n=1 Tax=Beggiatoa leptomitoformis TaxID=288004 RepID=A0A2N9YBV6_9GAMM|nr:hypothetical protein [Beggiatoa leptomitoformis]ALG66771.1 hypothetical protein AL038_02390 [Beggiatoa leptomitoformis]AUI67884.1 hypothetical protein BLE401_03650 [Beggiatoa leptomitoformis]